MARQQRRVVSNSAKFRRGERFSADAGVTVCCDDEVGALGYFRGHDQFRIGLHGNGDPGGASGGGEPIFGIRNHNPDNFDAAPA